MRPEEERERQRGKEEEQKIRVWGSGYQW